MIEASEDLSVFFQASDFGTTATYTPTGGSASSISVIFDKPFSSIPLEGDVDVEGNTPTVLCKSSDVSAAAHGDVLVVDSTTYHVVGVQQDTGSGYQSTTVLVLEEQ